MDFYTAWNWLYHHPSFFHLDIGNAPGFMSNLEVMTAKVDPSTGRVEDDETRNTKVEIWLEAGPYTKEPGFEGEVPNHDYRLDCGGDTYEQAIIKMANLVLEYYGDYKSD